MGTQLQPSQLNSPGKDIESYLSSVHAIPILTKEQEQELALKLYEEDDLDAARQLVIHHLRFVHIARSTKVTDFHLEISFKRVMLDL